MATCRRPPFPGCCCVSTHSFRRVSRDVLLRRQGLQFLGITGLYAFDPVREQWEHVGEMNHGRWYPTTCVLPDGGVLLLSGRNEGRGKSAWREADSGPQVQGAATSDTAAPGIPEMAPW